jgi:hypothetical protein
MVIVDDERTRHAVAPIAASKPNQVGYRDVLVATFRKQFDDIH